MKRRNKRVLYYSQTSVFFWYNGGIFRGIQSLLALYLGGTPSQMNGTRLLVAYTLTTVFISRPANKAMHLFNPFLNLVESLDQPQLEFLISNYQSPLPTKVRAGAWVNIYFDKLTFFILHQEDLFWWIIFFVKLILKPCRDHNPFNIDFQMISTFIA